MTEPWHKTETPAEAAAFSADFWQRHRDAIQSGEFWADKIKHLRGEPIERLRLAIDNLPLPGAFREAAIATRALIRERRKLKEPYEDQLTLLYWLAAIDSFSVPYSEKLQTPGYNIVEAVPGSELKSLPFTYAELGYKKLGLLNKTEPPRVLRKLQPLRGWSHEEDITTILPRAARACSADGAGAPGRSRIAVGGDRLDRRQGGLHARVAASLGAPGRA